jgi:hypothetical protein
LRDERKKRKFKSYWSGDARVYKVKETRRIYNALSKIESAICGVAGE